MKSLTSILLLILIGIIFYSLTFRGVMGNPTIKQMSSELTIPGLPFESSHERSPYALIVAYTTYGRFDLSRQLADMGSPDVSYHDGKFYSYFPPGLSLILMPFYIFGFNNNLAQILTYMPMVLFAILSMIFIYLIGRNVLKFPYWAAFLSAIIFAFATTSWSYSITIYQHILTTFLLLSSFYAVWKFSKGGVMSVIYALYVWLAYGVAFFSDYPNLILFVPVIIYFFLTSIKTLKLDNKFKIRINPIILLTSIVFVLLVSLHAYYNVINYGNYNKFAQSFPRYEKGKLEKAIKKDLKTSGKPVASEVKAMSNFSEQAIVKGMYELLIADDKGVFFFSPILILGLIFILTYRKIGIAEGVLISVIILNLIIYASFHDPWGGWAFGPRYLVPAMSILSLFSVGLLVNSKHIIISRIIAFVLIVYSSAVALLGVLTTNTLPPNTEAAFLKIKYGIPYALDFLYKGQTGNLVLNYFLKDWSLINYYALVFSLVIVLFFIVIFIIPIFSKGEKLNV